MQSDAADLLIKHRPRDSLGEQGGETEAQDSYTKRAVSFHERVKYREINQGGGENAKARGSAGRRGRSAQRILCSQASQLSCACPKMSPPKKRSGVFFLLFKTKNKKTSKKHKKLN